MSVNSTFPVVGSAVPLAQATGLETNNHDTSTTVSGRSSLLAPRSSFLSTLRSPLSLFLIIFSLSLLAWSGTFHTSDGISMYAVSDSLVRYGEWNIESIRWMGLQQGTYGPDGLLYSRKGLAVSLISLPLTALGYYLPGIGPVHTTLLLTPILHALTAVYLYYTTLLLLRRRGTDANRVDDPAHTRISLLVTFLWAFASMAFPYVKTFFSEPAVALSSVAALYHLLHWRDSKKAVSLLATGAWLGFSLLTRSANVIVFPFYGLALLAYLYESLQSPKQGWRWLFAPATLRAVAWLILPVVVSGLFYLWYNALRFGNPFESGYIEGEEFSAIWWQGLWGQTFGFGRGLFWYSPWLILSVVGAKRWWKREPAVILVAWGSAITYILFYGKWYLWSGGFAWGPRFLVPILPLLALLTAPLLERPTGRRTPAETVWWGLAILSFVINLIGVLWDFMLHQAWLEQTGLPLFAWETFVNPRYAQITGLLWLGIQNWNQIDLAWMVAGQVQPFILLALIATAFIGTVFVIGRVERLNGWQVGVIFGIVAMGLYGVLTQMYEAESPDLRAALALTVPIEDRIPIPTAQLWYDDPTATAAVLNQVKDRRRITGFFVDGPTLSPTEAPRAEALAENATTPIFLITDGPDHANNGLDRVLTQHLAFVEDQTPSRYRVTDYWRGALDKTIPYNLTFTFASGEVITLESAQVTSLVYRGGVVAATLTWHTETPLPSTAQVFMQLFDADGNPVAQKDGPLAQGTIDITSLVAGQSIVDRHAVRLPYERGTEVYLHTGLYRYDTLERAVTADGQNEIVIPIGIVVFEGPCLGLC